MSHYDLAEYPVFKSGLETMTELVPAHYRDIFHQASDALFIHDYASGTLVEANARASIITGYSPEELIGNSVETFGFPLPDYDRKVALARIHAAVEEGPQNFEWLLRHKDGHPFPVEVDLKAISISGKKHVLACFRDISERDQARRRLEESERRFRTLIENSAEGIAIVGETGLVRYASPSIVNVLGYSERRAVGRNVFQYLNPQDALGARTMLSHGLAGEGATWNFSYRILHRSGNWRHHEATIKDLRRDPNIGGFLVNFRDVTERLRTEAVAQQRQKLIEHLARVNVMGELGSTLSHELSQPFVAIANFVGGCLERMRTGSMAHDDLAQVLERMNAEAARAGRIISSLRNFSKRAEFPREQADINVLITEVIPLVQMRAEGAQVRLACDLGCNLPMVMCDRVLIEQVVLNIAFNAIEAICQAASDSGRVTFHTYAVNGQVHVAIEDTGPGLPKMNPDKIFDAFFTTKKEGLGIGLSLCRSIIDSHDGHLWFTAAQPVGSTFHFTLPVHATNKQAQRPRKSRQ